MVAEPETKPAAAEASDAATASKKEAEALQLKQGQVSELSKYPADSSDLMSLLQLLGLT